MATTNTFSNLKSLMKETYSDNKEINKFNRNKKIVDKMSDGELISRKALSRMAKSYGQRTNRKI